VRLRTSIHVQDALEEGLSLFMVELLRLKAIVDAARESDAITLLYIADEMLRGTNVQERRPAVGAVLRHLLHAGAIGAIATHDLELATEPELAAHARAVHLIERFRDTDAGPVMWFDYRLRPGVSTSRNALKLLEMVGLGGGDR
jgi:DNA mismatch repair ATPase MutS